VLAEHRVVQNDLLQQLDELVGQVGRHEGLDCDRHLLGVLGLRQSSLHHLQRERERQTDRRGQSQCVPPFFFVASQIKKVAS